MPALIVGTETDAEISAEADGVAVTGETSDEESAVEDVEESLVPQLPKPDWQPVPQYASVDPQYPDEEQQFPKDDEAQVIPADPPQVASVETVPDEVLDDDPEDEPEEPEDELEEPEDDPDEDPEDDTDAVAAG